MAVYHRGGRDFCVANRGTGACPTRAQRDAPARSLPTTPLPKCSGGPSQASGSMARATAPLVNFVRGWAAPALQPPTNWQSASGRERTHAVPAHRPRRGRRGRRAVAQEGLPTTPLRGCPSHGCHLRQSRNAGRVPQRSRGRFTHRQPQAQFANICGHRVGVGRRRQFTSEGPGEARAISASRGAFTPSRRLVSISP